MLGIMQHKGFGSQCGLHWMKLAFSSGTPSILLNGVPGKVFHCRLGVRQGDPLSPLLFVLAATRRIIGKHHTPLDAGVG